MKAIQYTALLLTALVLSACGAKVEVPPAHVGKILTKNGYAPETIPPSKFRLEPCWAYCDKLVLLQASDVGFTEQMQVFMPEDKLNLTVEVRGTLTVPTAKEETEMLFNRLTSQQTSNDRVNIISASMVYNTYGQQALRGVVRSEITKYGIQEVLENRETIGQNIHAAVMNKMDETHTPLVVSRFELADIQPPKVIVEAQQAAKKREIDVQRAEADAQVAMVEAERALEVAKAERLVEREKAAAIAEQNDIAAKSITPQLLEYRRLEVAERIYTRLANSKNEGLIIVPVDGGMITSVNEAAVFGKVVGRELSN